MASGSSTPLAAGNAEFVDENYEAAIEHYSMAIDADPSLAHGVDAVLNRSHAHFKMERFAGPRFPRDGRKLALTPP
jgi:hypothetical protein